MLKLRKYFPIIVIVASCIVGVVFVTHTGNARSHKATEHRSTSSADPSAIYRIFRSQASSKPSPGHPGKSNAVELQGILKQNAEDDAYSRVDIDTVRVAQEAYGQRVLLAYGQKVVTLFVRNLREPGDEVEAYGGSSVPLEAVSNRDTVIVNASRVEGGRIGITLVFSDAVVGPVAIKSDGVDHQVPIINNVAHTAVPMGSKPILKWHDASGRPSETSLLDGSPDGTGSSLIYGSETLHNFV